MSKEITYISVRTVKATSQDEAISKVEDGDFDESNDLCDRVLPIGELIEALLPLFEDYMNNKNKKQNEKE